MEGKPEEKETSEVSRRTVLNTVGATVGGSLVASGLSEARSDNGPRTFVGTTYDALTHVPQRRATAEIEVLDTGIEGRLSVGGFNVPLGQTEPLAPTHISGGNPTYILELTDSKFVRDGQPLKLKFEDYGHAINGYATRPHVDYSKLGFTLGDSDLGMTEEGIKRGLINNGEGIVPPDLDFVPTPPESGIPTNTSLSNLSRPRFMEDER